MSDMHPHTRAQNTQKRELSTEEHRTQNTERRTQNTEHTQSELIVADRDTQMEQIRIQILHALILVCSANCWQARTLL